MPVFDPDRPRLPTLAERIAELESQRDRWRGAEAAAWAAGNEDLEHLAQWWGNLVQRVLDRLYKQREEQHGRQKSPV